MPCWENFFSDFSDFTTKSPAEAWSTAFSAAFCFLLVSLTSFFSIHFSLSAMNASVSLVHASITPPPVMCSRMRVAPPQNFLLQWLHCKLGEVAWSCSTVTEAQIGPSRLAGAVGELRLRGACWRPRRVVNASVLELGSMCEDLVRIQCQIL